MARGRLILWLGLLAGIATCVPVATASAAPVVPPAFALKASNGYSIHVLSFDGNRFGKPDGLILFVSRTDGGAAYFVRKGAQVTESTVSATLGGLGSIDVHFVPTGGTKSETSACDPHPIEVEAGYYEGHIDFEGEEGYTQAHQLRARAEVRVLASLICAGGIDEGFGGHAPGARLLVRRHWPRGGLEFEATKNSPTRPARFRAAEQEWHEDIVVSREVRAKAGPAAFRFDVPAQTAVLHPPSPFKGAARFLRSSRHPGRLTGALTIDFPGRSNVSLSGARGSLQRWVQNPSHPFRPARFLRFAHSDERQHVRGRAG